jgi:hypothetical protein
MINSPVGSIQPECGRQRHVDLLAPDVEKDLFDGVELVFFTNVTLGG